MKKICFLSLLSLLFVTMPSCSDELDGGKENPGAAGGRTLFTATVEALQSEADTETQNDFWAPGDKIKLVLNDNSSLSANLIAGQGTESGSFSPRVQHNPVRTARQKRLVQLIDQRALTVALKKRNLVPPFAAIRQNPLVNFRQRPSPVNFPLAQPRQIQIHPVYHQKFHNRPSFIRLYFSYNVSACLSSGASPKYRQSE